MLDFLDSGGSRAQVAQIVLNSGEYRTKLAQSLFKQFLGRAATQTEVNFFLSALQQGMTVEQLIAVIVGSDEYYQNRGGGMNNGFLEHLYNDLLGRPIDEGGLASFTDLLNRGGSRQQVALFILGSSEYRSNQIQSFFRTFLERQAGDSEINFFLALWQQGARREQIIAQIIGSPEYCELAGRTPRGHHS
jgi:type III secretory pathway component EscR